MSKRRTRHVVNDLLSTLARVLRGILLSQLSLQLLAQSHSSIALVVVLHLDVGVLSNLSPISTQHHPLQEFQQESQKFRGKQQQ